MHASASFFQPILTHALFVNGKSDSFHEGPHRAGIVRMRQQNAVNAGSKHLLEHPSVGSDRCFIYAVNGHVDDDGGRSMPAFWGTALHPAAQVFGKSLYRERRMPPVVADIFGRSTGLF